MLCQTNGYTASFVTEVIIEPKILQKKSKGNQGSPNYVIMYIPTYFKKYIQLKSTCNIQANYPLYTCLEIATVILTM